MNEERSSSSAVLGGGGRKRREEIWGERTEDADTLLGHRHEKQTRFSVYEARLMLRESDEHVEPQRYNTIRLLRHMQMPMGAQIAACCTVNRFSGVIIRTCSEYQMHA